ncbi:WASH complex subunit 3 [Wyeomyia smithii]|uniref:WASH complex subunit 3 n=1 Tax=Wyeomyia smithii TaxID=174621 RepID=UPI002467F4A4|nr:WASH complex subunit 3 [Wyeomyia smithii]
MFTKTIVDYRTETQKREHVQIRRIKICLPVWNSSCLLKFIMETVGLEKHELPPTNQKRMVAFINHFILSTVSFLNQFATDCESKLVAHEYKMQSLEASLLIVEAKLASIDALKTDVASAPSTNPSSSNDTTNNSGGTDDVKEDPPSTEQDPRYERYLKMVRVGVPVLVVKNKISSEGLDPDYIDRFL